MHDELSTSARRSDECSQERELRVLEMLSTFYAAAGNPPDADGALALMARVLSGRADPQVINAALDRCLFECRYPIRLPDILQRLPGTEAADVNAEKRLAWEKLTAFVAKYIGNDVHGNYSPDFGWYGPQLNSRGEVVRAASYPQLSQRILDTIRRTGGWKIYALMANEDYPHQQKRFFEEYEAWTAVERIADHARLMEIPRMKAIIASKSMEPLTEMPVRKLAPVIPTPAPRSPQKARIMKRIDEVKARTRENRESAEVPG